jgi:glucosamine-6-phosphate deaminase
MEVVMNIEVFDNKKMLGAAAARKGAEAIKRAIECQGYARIIVATGASQFEMLEALRNMKGIDWSKVDAFHLDEYVGISKNHPASFRKYLKERFVDHLPTLRSFTYINGDASDLEQECMRIGTLVSAKAIDVAFVGIGENGHLAFNDPPADFDTEKPYLIVDLDLACRGQQLGEGWFESLEDVPKQAVSMAIKQIMKSKTLIVTVPDKRKANAVSSTVLGQVTPNCPASIMQQHSDCHLYLDNDSASLLSK